MLGFRTFKQLRCTCQILWFAALASCASDSEPEYDEGDLVGHITRSVMFSAYDGVHEYSVTASVADAVDDPKSGSNPVLASSIKWEVDSAFVSVVELTDRPHGIKLTMKKAGTTRVTLIAKHVVGALFRQRAALTISRATPDEWEAGEARFKEGPRVLLPDAFEESDAGTCGLAEEISYPNTAACISCHAERDERSDAVVLTPTETSGWSDDDLVQMISAGAKPTGGTYNSEYLRKLRMPDCVYRAIHSYQLRDDEKRGIVWKLRSIPPRAVSARSD